MQFAVEHLEQAGSSFEAALVAVNMRVGVVGKGHDVLVFPAAHNGVEVVGGDHRQSIAQLLACRTQEFAFGVGVRRFRDHRAVQGEIDTV